MVKIKTRYFEFNQGPNRTFETSINNFLNTNVVKPEVEKQIRELPVGQELLIKASYGLFFMERMANEVSC